MRTLAALLFLVALTAVAVYAGHVSQLRVERALADRCIALGEAPAVCLVRYGLEP
jgi:hypothetical protein